MKVSYIVPIRNEYDYISETINAILKQNISVACEILVSDGGSTDGTLQIINGLICAGLLKTKDTSFVKDKHLFLKHITRKSGGVVSWDKRQYIYKINTKDFEINLNHTDG